MQDPNLDCRDLPNSEGVYLIRNPVLNKFYPIEIYNNAHRGFCCFSEDGVSVQDAGLEFITKMRELDKNAMGRKISS